MTMRENYGSIATGGSAANPLPSNNDRLNLIYANTSSGPLLFSASANQPASATVGVPVAAGATFQFPPNPRGERGHVPTGPVTVYGATAGQTFMVIEESMT